MGVKYAAVGTSACHQWHMQWISRTTYFKIHWGAIDTCKPCVWSNSWRCSRSQEVYWLVGNMPAQMDSCLSEVICYCARIKFSRGCSSVKRTIKTNLPDVQLQAHHVCYAPFQQWWRNCRMCVFTFMIDVACINAWRGFSGKTWGKTMSDDSSLNIWCINWLL